jgi:hypothetical protein
MRATGLGRDPITGCIMADPNWWKSQNDVSVHCLIVFFSNLLAQLLQSYYLFQAMSGCISFRDAPLEHEEQIRIMFDAISVTNETSFVPSTNGGECETVGLADGVDNNEG